MYEGSIIVVVTRHVDERIPGKFDPSRHGLFQVNFIRGIGFLQQFFEKIRGVGNLEFTVHKKLLFTLFFGNTFRTNRDKMQKLYVKKFSQTS